MLKQLRLMMLVGADTMLFEVGPGRYRQCARLPSTSIARINDYQHARETGTAIAARYGLTVAPMGWQVLRATEDDLVLGVQVPTCQFTPASGFDDRVLSINSVLAQAFAQPGRYEPGLLGLMAKLRSCYPHRTMR